MSLLLRWYSECHKYSVLLCTNSNIKNEWRFSLSTFVPFIFLIEFHYFANNAFHSSAFVTSSEIHYPRSKHFFAYILNSFAPNSVMPTSGPFSVLLHLHAPRICFSLRDCWLGIMQCTWRQTLTRLLASPYPSICHVNSFKCWHFGSLSWRLKCHVLLAPRSASLQWCRTSRTSST